ncbi:MAG TPA: hypothetical protein VLA78_09045, partial [Paracoccaceae bacterium]|nr:hypothetical protein [Paracoccaceae bacterium]
MSKRNADPRAGRPVFLDPTRRRARLLGVLAGLAVGLLAVWVGLFWISIFLLGALPPGPLPRPADEIALTPAPETAACIGDPLQAGDLRGNPAGLAVHAVLRTWPESAVPALVARCDGLRSVYAEW